MVELSIHWFVCINELRDIYKMLKKGITGLKKKNNDWDVAHIYTHLQMYLYL